jgi:hypothetical protein
MSDATTGRLFVRCMAGSCRNGFERDSGRLYHAVVCDADPSYSAVPALCGRRPGRRSAGWSQASAPGVTCPRCQKKAAEVRDVPRGTVATNGGDDRE